MTLFDTYRYLIKIIFFMIHILKAINDTSGSDNIVVGLVCAAPYTQIYFFD